MFWHVKTGGACLGGDRRLTQEMGNVTSQAALQERRLSGWLARSLRVIDAVGGRDRH